MRTWLAGARLRTLPAAVTPVVVGTAVAAQQGELHWWRAPAALIVALAIQVGTNYANDYGDGIRGTDDARVGPARLVASGLRAPAEVRRAAWMAFAVAGAAGLALSAAVSWWLVPVGLVCLAAGWLYTGGPRPYGYAGLGEVFVFVFFGLVATAGSAYVHVEHISSTAVLAGVAIGCLASALLVVNNLRDAITDAAAGKVTLAVRLGDARTRRLYSALITVAFVVGIFVATHTWVTLLAMPLAVPLVLRVRRGARGSALMAVLAKTGRLQLAYGALLALGVTWS